MDELPGSGDLDVDAFVDSNLRSFAAWDVVVYLEHNFGVSADVSDLSGRLGRKEFEIEGVLGDLVANKVATTSSEPDGQVRYTLTSDPRMRTVVSRFVDLTKTREIRLEFVRRVLSQMSRG